LEAKDKSLPCIFVVQGSFLMKSYGKSYRVTFAQLVRTERNIADVSE